MKPTKKRTLIVDGNEIRLDVRQSEDFFSLTDIARKFSTENPSALLINWLRNKDTIEFVGVWEKLHNPSFNLIEFDKIRNEAGTNRFVISPGTWATVTNAIGIESTTGRYGGTMAHRDIAFEFLSHLSPTFKLFVIKEFQRLKEAEAGEQKLAVEWNVRRALTKINYRLQTDAVRTHLVPPRLVATKMEGLFFASEADLLNLSLFGKTAADWRKANPELRGNVRDHATIEQLLVLANLENLNAAYIKLAFSTEERLRLLNEEAIHQMGLLIDAPAMKQLGEGGGVDKKVE